MARIKDDDIQLVRERARIDEVVEAAGITLRNAGGGSRKGLCPFHDEKSPSFNVRPAQGFYHCFGCGAGGDSIKFLMEHDHVTFVEAVERLAGKYGIQLRYEEDGAPRGPQRDPRQRGRLLEAHQLAAEFYAQHLFSAPEAQAGRTFVTDRGFTQAAAETFGMGFAPRSGEALVGHLKGRGFSDEELVVAGLAGRGSRGLYDRFRGRLLWPIREMSGEVVGFGARRIFDDDRIEAKYLNTSETPIYKKSQVLYGIDLARRAISSSSQAVVVEGYTDVMACHEAGVKTAVATCGTAFGEDHARILRRIMLDHDAFHGEVIFTFDGDAAGQRAAIRTFEGDQQFVAQTYVAVEPRGMDPCDLRLADGDEAVQQLVSSRIPLYRFVLDNTLSKYDLDRGDQRVDAVREAVGLATAIRDRAKTDEFVREIATKVGVEVDQVRSELRKRSGKSAAPKGRPQARTELVDERPAEPAVPAVPEPSLGEARFNDEREALKAIVQHPEIAVRHVGEISVDDFTHPRARAIWQEVSTRGLPQRQDASWLPAVADALDEPTRRILMICATDPVRSREATAARVVQDLIGRLRVATVQRQLAEAKSRLQRADPADADGYRALFEQVMALEERRRSVQDAVLGA
ncbi:DNA primase [Aeromicrobium sp. IC_218]|uniref:DNA primase n=1 Tax=Aeromicrobium sp. IC_218 TaxID=2545468 RepID=UPI00103A94A2|nr:DNA primase [Aeromicrobium sp. IC_218]TCI96743.1 DNA primase [Aeromicrobium sp. IC_218]